MRFRSKGKPRGQLSTRDQLRARLVIGGIAIIVLILSAARKDSWLTGLLTSPSQQPSSAANTAAENLLGPDRLRADEFELAPDNDPSSPPDYASMIDKRGAAQMEAGPPDAEQTGDIPAKLKRMIRDDEMGVVSSETEAWLGTLRMAKNLTPSQKQLLPEGQYALFMAAPQACRGKAYVIRGQLRRLIETPLPIGAEDYGIRVAYEAWISTPDSGAQKIRVVALSAAGLPLGTDLGNSGPFVEVAGFFFKRQGYEARGAKGTGTIMLTPLILCGKIVELQPTEVASRAAEMNPWLTGIGICVALGVLLIVWQFQLSDQSFRGTRTHQLTNLPVRPSFDGVSAVTIQQALQKMQDTARENNPDTTLLSN